MMPNSIRIVVLDYYMSPPIPALDLVYSEFRGTSINQVPILRCFGSTENGRKICAHIHGVFPYFYIPYDGKGKPEELMYQIASALDKAINVSFNQSNSNAQHVYKISLVSGIPMYGFHSKKHQFFKIYLYNPKLVSRAGSILLNKNILDQQVFQPHEIHLNFTLQFMIDYNLHGMSNMLISDMKYRQNLDDVNADIDKDSILPPNIERTSTCELEGDINAESILNRQEILSGNLAVNPGIAALWEDEKQRRRNKNEDSQLGKFLELKNINTPPTKTHLIFQQALGERLAVFSTDNNEFPKDGFEASIYPAETPSDSTIQNASLIDIHSTSSLELSSLDDTLNLSCSQHNKTLTQCGENFNATMDDDAQAFLHLLQDLAEEKIAEEEKEEESILSQVAPLVDQNDDDLAEDLFDLSMPLEALTTPVKLNTVTRVNDKNDEEDVDYFNTTFVPQLDGQTDDDECFSTPSKELLDRLAKSYRKSQLVINCGKAKRRKSLPLPDVSRIKTDYTKSRSASPKLYRKSQIVINSGKPKCLRSMPVLDVVCSLKTDYTSAPANPLDKFNLVTPVKLERVTSKTIVKVEPLNPNKILLRDSSKIIRNRRTPEAILDETIRLVRHRISRIALKSKIKRIGHLMLAHEKSMMRRFEKPMVPKFKVLPACKWFLEKHSNGDGHCTGTVISRLLELTHNYTDPDLRAIIKTPSASYLFTYLRGPPSKTTHCSTPTTLLYNSSLKNNNGEVDDDIKRKKLFYLWKRILNIEKKLPESHCNNNNNNNSPGNSFNTEEHQEDVVNANASEQEPTRHQCLDPKYQADLRREAEEANDALQGHLGFLRDFDLNLGFPDKDNTKRSSLSDIRCLNDEKMIETPKSSQSVSTAKNERRLIISSSFDHTYARKPLAQASSGKLQPKELLDNSASYKKIAPSSPSTRNIYLSFSTDSQSSNCPSEKHTSVSKLGLKLSRSVEDEEIEAHIDIRLVSPFRSKCVRRNAIGGVPFASGKGAPNQSKASGKEAVSFDKKHSQPTNLPKRRRLAIPNIYINCDGTADSTSEDEEEREGVKRRKLRSSQYTPLGITVTKSPSAGTHSGNCQRRFAENAVQFTGDRKFFQVSGMESGRAAFPYKRQLSFEHENSLDKTLYEERLSCTYTCESVSKIIKKSATNHIHSYTELVGADDNNSRSDSDLFSEDDDLNKSFFKSCNLSVSEKYDRENKYRAKEGCSTIFTPSSYSRSQEKNKDFSGSTTSDIPPYQEPSDDLCNIIKPSFKAPSRLQVEQTLTKYHIPRVRQQEPYYSNVDDYTGIAEIGHRIMRIASKTTAHLSEFDSEFDGLNKYRKYFIENVANLTWNPNNVKHLKMAYCSNNFTIVRPVKKPPSVNQVEQWLNINSKVRQVNSETKSEYVPSDDSDLDLSLSSTVITASASQMSPKAITLLLSSEEVTNKSYQITGVTQDNNSFGFDKSVQDLQAARALTVHQYLTTMVMELHIRTRGELKPDPELDNICAVFYSILNDVPECHQKTSKARGVIAINSLPADLGASRPDFFNGIEIDSGDITVKYVHNENALINSFVDVIKYWDPDILAGYEIEMLSWGYLVDRACVLSINILPLLGRSKLHKYGNVKLKTLMSEVDTSNIVGRIVLDVWRIMRHEIALQSYTFESIVYHILHRRIPFYQPKDLTFWWDHRSNLYRHRVVKYYLQRVDTVLELFDKLDFLNRTSELARLFGIQFYEVLSRGSQFRVESMMLRLAKPLNFVPVSPDTKQRANMRAPEYIPLIMEPESKFYTDPVIVLDFQSLYPSIIIAYNYCFTTCAGRVNNLGTNHSFEFGATQLKVPKKVVEKLHKRDLLNYSPCGVAFVKQKVREGILPRMLKEVLDTRLMVKNSMKENRGDDNLQKVLHNRQLGLKLIANVTYGYTAANFSGRMCCVEVGDSVVSKGRETLQRAIALVESTPEWQAKVVYGDTDSMFVLTPGKTREEAFEIGKKIADAVTADNPDPVTLKLEKVYQPCVLQTKKRYVGYMYEGPEQTEPVYEAKGIETVRRDGCPAVAKMLQKCLTILFETKNVSIIKNYVLKQFNKIQTGRASIQDLTFAKEYRGSSGYKSGACVPALELARWKAVDKRSEPRNGERVPYVIVNGPPGLPLIRLVKSPRDLLNDSSLRPNALYYITKVIIPPINRCLNLIGADLNVWFSQMPRKNTQYLPNSSPIVKSTISQYFISKICACCAAPSQEGLCAKCGQNAGLTALVLTEKLKRWEANYHNTVLICQTCTRYVGEVVCASLDCPILYRRTQTFNDLQQSTYVRELLTNSVVFAGDDF